MIFLSLDFNLSETFCKDLNHFNLALSRLMHRIVASISSKKWTVSYPCSSRCSLAILICLPLRLKCFTSFSRSVTFFLHSRNNFAHKLHNAGKGPHSTRKSHHNFHSYPRLYLVVNPPHKPYSNLSPIEVPSYATCFQNNLVIDLRGQI